VRARYVVEAANIPTTEGAQQQRDQNRKTEEIVRQEMVRAGALEVEVPILQPRELWEESGRWERYVAEEILFHLTDRKGGEYCLAPTAEEAVTTLVRATVTSYRQLPLTLFQIRTKFRDEIRPRFGRLVMWENLGSCSSREQVARVLGRIRHVPYLVEEHRSHHTLRHCRAEQLARIAVVVQRSRNALFEKMRMRQKMRELQAPRRRIVFFGDSITDFWRLNEYYPDRDFVNRGISGQVTDEMLARMKAAAEASGTLYSIMTRTGPAS